MIGNCCRGTQYRRGSGNEKALEFSSIRRRHCGSFSQDRLTIANQKLPLRLLRPSKHHTLLCPAERYSLLKFNAGVIGYIQVGITLNAGVIDAGLVGDFSKATWVAFHGCYDFAILLKALLQLTTRMRVRLL